MDLDSAMERVGGIGTRTVLVGLMGRHCFDNAVKGKRVLAVFPRVYAYPWDLDLADVRRRAALLSVGGDAALSHVTVLNLQELPAPGGHPLHVTAYQPRHPRGVPGELIVHRTLLPLDPTDIDGAGVPIQRLERAVVASWPLLPPGPEQRAPFIEAARRRLLSPARLVTAAESMYWVRGIADARTLVAAVVGGCESELELYGYEHVFDVPGLRDAQRQRVVRVAGKSYRLDISYDDERLNIELDGRQFHASPEQWERDIARDLAVATLGWQTIRFSHRRLHGDVDGCRRDALAVRAARARRVG